MTLRQKLLIESGIFSVIAFAISFFWAEVGLGGSVFLTVFSFFVWFNTRLKGIAEDNKRNFWANLDEE